jgi:AAA+ superfamily predicted ATPase
MAEQNNPIDVGREQIRPNKDAIEKFLVQGVTFNTKKRDITELIRQIDKEEPYIMGDIETKTYLAIRDGLQIFDYVAKILSDKTGLQSMLAKVSSARLDTDPELLKLKDFCYNFAAFAASSYVSKKLDSELAGKIEKPEDEKAKADKPDLSMLKLNTKKTKEDVMIDMVTPLYAVLVRQTENGRDVFKTPSEFPLFVKEVFDKFKDITKEKKGTFGSLDDNLKGYRFRIMDDFISLEGYEDKGVTITRATEKQLSFRPITPKEIVGNQDSKRKITRYIERLTLYDPKQKMNPILNMGGLAWSTLLDGPPGTGKSSMFRLAMTILKQRCEQIGLPFNIFTIDPSIKDEYYGKTGKILLERLAVTRNPLALSLGIWDDLDLLTTTRRDAQGADNDINNISMQYYDGVYTLRLGNVINFAATNKPTGLDNAFRNRFNDRLLVEGPLTEQDFADIIMLELGNLIKTKRLVMEPGKGYIPFATQDVKDEKGKWTAKDVSSYMADEFAKYKKASVIDFGRFMADLKKKNPTITGRSAKAIVESIKERCADFDIPDNWYENRKEFFDQPYERKVEMIKSLYKEITPEILFEEAQRYADSEARYSRKEAEEEIQRGYNSRVWGIQAEVKLMEDQIKKGAGCDLGKLAFLKSELNQIVENAEKTIRGAYEKAAKEEQKRRE